MIKSPLRYPGGKSRAASFLYKFAPRYKELREPFFGGGSFSFFSIQKRPNANYYASDINYDLYCFWNTLKNNKQEMIDEILQIKKNNKDGRKLFNSLIEKRQSEMAGFNRAVDFFVLNRITFSGVVDSGGYSEQAFHKRFTISSIERLEKAYHIVKNIDFSPEDYSELLYKEGEGIFIFLDPPYYSATKSKLYGKNGCLHTTFDHEVFFRNLTQCKHKWLLTYDNSTFIQSLFKDFHQIEWELQYGMNNYRQKNAGIGKELLIANYDINQFVQREKTLF